MPRRVRGRYIYRYGEDGNWVYAPTKQATLASARNWSSADECLVEVREIECPFGSFRAVVCGLLNQRDVKFKERRLAAFRNGRAIPAWEEEWKT